MAQAVQGDAADSPRPETIDPGMITQSDPRGTHRRGGGSAPGQTTVEVEVFGGALHGAEHVADVLPQL